MLLCLFLPSLSVPQPLGQMCFPCADYKNGKKKNKETGEKKFIRKNGGDYLLLVSSFSSAI